ncbi:DM9 repeat-containing protein [Legionella tunisiensis]|uniref:DM9 repeat-containing protein n=1 Tax=Legionella tunisiensis TaxID=1034944 RepID=UPI0002E52347|nr:DM9 repeat-containing protein [Legionella tunisiensis]
MRVFYFLCLAFCLPSLASANYNHYHRYPTHSLANAFRTGTDTNGKALYLCIARLFNSSQPGKTWAGYGRCNVPYGGKEYIVDEFDIPPRQLFNHTQWQGDHGELPLRIGRDSNGAPLFLCQAFLRVANSPVRPGLVIIIVIFPMAAMKLLLIITLYWLIKIGTRIRMALMAIHTKTSIPATTAVAAPIRLFSNVSVDHSANKPVDSIVYAQSIELLVQKCLINNVLLIALDILAAAMVV